MALTKRTYTDGVTIITAENLNAIQDEIIWQAANQVPTSRKINNNALTSDISLTAANVGAAPIDHSNTATTYGKGTNTKYGHVKLTDSLTDSTTAATGGLALSAKAGADLKDALTQDTLHDTKTSILSDPTSLSAIANYNVGIYRVAISGTTIFPFGYGILEVLKGNVYGVARFTSINKTEGEVWWLEFNTTNGTIYGDGWKKDTVETAQQISAYAGKKVSIIGDSISTYDATGYKYDSYGMYYPSHEDLTSVDETWWKKVIDNSGAIIERNLSYSGSRATDTHPSSLPDFYSRVSLLGTPDTIFIELGTNDSFNNIALGDYDFSTAYTSLSESTFRPAYTKGMKAIKATYPNAEVVAVITLMADAYKNSIIHICDMLGIKWVNVMGYDSDNDNHAHPNKAGMRQIASKVLTDVGYLLDVGGLYGITSDPSSVNDLMDYLPGNYRVFISNSTIFPFPYGVLEIIHSGAFGLARITRMNSTFQEVFERGWNRLTRTWYDSTWKQVNKLYPSAVTPTFSKVTSNSTYESINVANGLAVVKCYLTASENIAGNTATAIATDMPKPISNFQFMAQSPSGASFKMLISTSGVLQTWYTGAIASGDVIIVDTCYFV